MNLLNEKSRVAADQIEYPAYYSSLQHIDPVNLISHQESVCSDLTFAQVYKKFETHPYEFMAVLENNRPVGICSRGHVGFLMASHNGNKVHGREKIGDHLKGAPQKFPRNTPIQKILDATLNRPKQDFNTDIVLTEPDGSFLGLIELHRLIQIQSQMVVSQIRKMEMQQRVVCEKNNLLLHSLNKLKNLESQFSILFENCGIAVALLNNRAEVETSNRQFLLLFGLEKTSKNSGFRIVDWIRPDQKKAFLSILFGQSTSDPARQGRFHFQLPVLGSRVFELFISRIKDTGQTCLCMTDRTEQVIMEQRMIQKEKHAMLDTLIGGVAHEINNKLQPILGCSELLKMILRGHDIEDEDLLDYCTTIKENAGEASKIIKQLLQLSKPIHIEPTPGDITALVRSCIKMMGLQFQDHQVKVVTHIPAEGVLVKMDCGQIKQVLVNLIGNALDAMEAQPVRELRVLVEPMEQYVRISVKDTGKGIKPEDISRIFDPFFTTKGAERGTGLGLSVSLSIVKNHTGELTVESIPGVGSCFTIQLPLYTERLEEVMMKGVVESEEKLKHKIQNVLVVDDQEMVLNIIQDIFKKGIGCEVETAASAREALKKISRSTFDLIISDIRMPEMTGMDFLEWIQSNHPRLASRFIFVTGDEGSLEMVQKIRSIRIPVLKKPFYANDLLTMCDGVLATSR